MCSSNAAYFFRKGARKRHQGATESKIQKKPFFRKLKKKGTLRFCPKLIFSNVEIVLYICAVMENEKYIHFNVDFNENFVGAIWPF